MKPAAFPFWSVCCFALLLTLSSAVTLSCARGEPSTDDDDERTLRSAGLSGEDSSLLAFFHARARRGVEEDHLLVLLRQLVSGTKEECDSATAELLGLGPLALPLVRQAANDLDRLQVAARASRCLPWLEGPTGNKLLIAAARTLAQRQPEGAAAALLAYLPFAVDADVIAAVNAALVALAAPQGKPDPALVRGLGDPVAVRRAAAGVALCRAAPADQVPDVRKLLKDPAAGVRLRAAMALAEAHDAEALPVLIDLLGELDAEKRVPVEDFLTELAGEWAPRLQFPSEDEVSQHIRRDAWASWWRHSDGPVLLAAVRAHTLNAARRRKIADWIARLADESFAERENASKELFALGRLALPQLQEASKHKDAEVARRARQLIEDIEQAPARPLPVAALRLLAVRKPAGSVEALLDYLPHAEDETRREEARKALTALARRDGKLDPALVQALSKDSPLLRETAIEALAAGGGAEGRLAVHKLIDDKSPAIRLRVALALARARQRDSIPVLINLLAELPAEQAGPVEEALYQLAGESAPDVSLGTEPAERKKCRDAWADWWKANAKRADLARLGEQSLLGFTVICDNANGRVYEIDRHGKERWAIDKLMNPLDAVVLPGNSVLIADHQASCVSERDFKGNILWQKQVTAPSRVQRLPNGNTFIATYEGTILEVDRAGKEIYTIQKITGNVRSAFRLRQGPIVYLTQEGECVLVDTTGKRLKSFDTHHTFNDKTLDWVDPAPNGRILITQSERNKVVEYTTEGKKVLDVDAPQPTRAISLPNGHILVGSHQDQRVYELNRAGKIVWEYKSSGPIIRARRR